MFAWGALGEEDGGCPFTADYRSVIATALACLSKIAPTCNFNFADLLKGLDDEMETLNVATTTAEKTVERGGLVLIIKKSANNTLNDVTSLLQRVAGGSAHGKSYFVGRQRLCVRTQSLLLSKSRYAIRS